MTDYKPITGELRRNMVTDETCSKERLVYYLRIDEVVFVNLCDRIDSIHAGLERENAALRERLAKMNEQGADMHGGGSSSITDELRIWADGNALRAGMSLRVARDQALAIADRIDAEHERAVMSAMNDALADGRRHYHAPTVEDVLREMLDAWGELPAEATNEAIVAEYAAKLRLAGDAE